MNTLSRCPGKLAICPVDYHMQVVIEYTTFTFYLRVCHLQLSYKCKPRVLNIDLYRDLKHSYRNIYVVVFSVN